MSELYNVPRLSSVKRVHSLLPVTNSFPLRREKYVWFVALLAGNTAAYACRTTMPLVSPVIAKDLSWSKTEAGTVLSSFFWGYALTQVNTLNYCYRTYILQQNEDNDDIL